MKQNLELFVKIRITEKPQASRRTFISDPEKVGRNICDKKFSLSSCDTFVELIIRTSSKFEQDKARMLQV